MNAKRVMAGVPSYSGMVNRERLHRILGCSTRGLIVIAAPAGYGKTVLASQLAHELDGSVVWLQIRGATVEPTRFFQTVCREIQRWGGCLANAGHGGASDPCCERVCMAIAHARPLTLVLDDVGSAADPHELADALSRLRSFGPSPDTVIVTTRAESAEWIASLSPDTVVGAEGLAFSAGEVRAAVGLLGDQDASRQLLEHIVDLSRGHPATVAVLARQATVQPVLADTAGIDLSAHLSVLAKSQLDGGLLETLCALSLLSSGSLSSLETCISRNPQGDLRSIAARIPLIQYPVGPNRSGYGIHALASSVYGSRDFMESVGLDYSDMLNRAIAVLDGHADYYRLFQLVEGSSDLEIAVHVLLRHGSDMVAAGGLCLLESVLELVPTRITLLTPRLLLLQVQILREKMCFEEAISKAAVARDLAEIEEDAEALTEALMLLARLQIDKGLMAEAVLSLERVLTVPVVSREVAATAASYLHLCHSFLGNRVAADANARLAEGAITDCGVGPATRVRVLTSLATTAALMDGSWSDALSLLQAARRVSGAPTTLSIQTDGNIGTAFIETGNLDRGETALEAAVSSSERYGLRMLELSYRDSLALARACRGDYEGARALMEDAMKGCAELGDSMELSRQYAYTAMFARAAGWHDESLQYAERSMEEAASLQCPWLRWMGSLEVAASLLVQGDDMAARRQAEWVRSEALELSSERYVLTADLILAAHELAQGNSAEAIRRIAAHAVLIRGNHSNYLLMLYVRAFPSLLVALAMLDEGIPRRVLRFTPTSTVHSALDFCDAHGLAEAEAVLTEATDDGRLSDEGRHCHVRLFGGLDVRVGERTVRERDWRKRKARVLFALMVLQRGRDLPREQICDLLWPHLDAERARNNFYVIWSIMKSALAPDAPKGLPLEFADNTAGLCRIDVERVVSDVEHFAKVISAARVAEQEEDYTAATSRYQELAGIYVGDLLPGDLYDDCFSAARDRYRTEFCDAMRRGVKCAERVHDGDTALEFARRGLDADPLSEDLYQAMIRFHIGSGQRSAAIDAYFTCRQRLCDDLGLDPSAETMRLYEQILVMDDGGDVPPDLREEEVQED